MSAKDKQLVSVSKFLSLVLRHQPEVIGVSLDDAGWVEIDTLLAAADRHGKSISRELLEEVVTSNDKQRFIISDDGLQIRANQGHSVAVDLGLQPQAPPSVLFHGTVTKFLQPIAEQGLLKGKRQHVHLSPDRKTATVVGSRRGKPVILEIASDRMAAANHVFFLSENGVWLTDHVPPEFLHFPDDNQAAAS